LGVTYLKLKLYGWLRVTNTAKLVRETVLTSGGSNLNSGAGEPLTEYFWGIETLTVLSPTAGIGNRTSADLIISWRQGSPTLGIRLSIKERS